MTTPATLEPLPAAPAAAEDDEFTLDMRVIEFTTPLVIMMCDTDDNCGSTCDNSACITASNDPF